MKYTGKYDESLPVPQIPHRIRYTYSGHYFAAYCGDWRPCKTGKGVYRPTIVIGKVIYHYGYFGERLIPNENYHEFMEKYCE